MCGQRDETIKHNVIECSKLVQKVYYARNDWRDKMMPWELCLKLKFDLKNKWYMHELESVLENETHTVH